MHHALAGARGFGQLGGLGDLKLAKIAAAAPAAARATTGVTTESTANLDGVASKAPLSRHHREVSVSDISSIGLGARAPGAIQPLEDDIRGLPGNPVLVAGACAVMGTLIPAGAAFAEEAASLSVGNGAITALFGAAVVLLTVVTGSVGYLTYVQWLDNKTEKEERKKFEQAVASKEYQEQLASFRGAPAKKKKARRGSSDDDGPAGFG